MVRLPVFIEMCWPELPLADRVAQQEGVTLCLEPLDVRDDNPGYWLTTMAQAADLVEQVDVPSLKILYDMYHQQVTEVSILANLRNYAPYIGHIHVASVPGVAILWAAISIIGRYLPPSTTGGDDLGYSGFVGLKFRPPHIPRPHSQRQSS
jgi:hydroxypyruvate isomerase